MKFRLLVKLGELIFRQGLSEDRPRADMYLPLWLPAFGIALITGGVFFWVLTVFRYTLVGLVLCICFIPLGIAAILCWRNQTIVILTPDTFQYTTFLGRKRVSIPLQTSGL